MLMNHAWVRWLGKAHISAQNAIVNILLGSVHCWDLVLRCNSAGWLSSFRLSDILTHQLWKLAWLCILRLQVLVWLSLLRKWSLMLLSWTVVCHLSACLDWLYSSWVASWMWLSWLLILINVHLYQALCLRSMHESVVGFWWQLGSLGDILDALRVLIYILRRVIGHLVMGGSVIQEHCLVLHIGSNVIGHYLFVCLVASSHQDVFFVTLIIVAIREALASFTKDWRYLLLHLQWILVEHIVILLLHYLVLAQ